MERNPAKVLDKIRQVIPESEKRIHAELDKAYRQATYKGPEQINDTWCDLAAILNETMMGDRRLQPSDPNWKRKAIQIFMGEEDEREEQVLLHRTTT